MSFLRIVHNNTQIKSAEAAATFQPTPDFAALPDYARHARTDTLDELAHADLARMKRVFVYSFGAAEALLLDRLNPSWKATYFRHLLSTDVLFQLK